MAPPRFSVTPEDIIYVNLGDAIILNCQAEGTPTPEILWYKDANPVEPSATIGIFNDGTELRISNIRHEDIGDYTCIARNGEGQISHTARVIIAGGAVIMVPPTNQTKLEGEKVQFSCEAKALPGNVTVKWYREGVYVKEVAALETRVTIRRDGSLIVNPVSADDSGQYMCEVTNGIGDPQSASAFLNVECKSIHNTWIFVTIYFLLESSTIQHKSAKCFATELEILIKRPILYGLYLLTDPAKVTFTPTVQYLPFRLAGVVQCYIKANPPLQYVTWTKDKRLLEPYQTKDIVIMNNGSLLFTRVNQNHQGRYTCTPYNAQGTQGSSGPMEVLVRKPPVFTVEPDNLYQRKVGETVEMHCDAQEAEGTQKPNIQWQRRDGSPLQRNRVRANGGNITIEGLRRTDFGFYQCVASNEVATIVTATQLVVEGTQPHAPYNVTANATEFAVTLSWLPGYSGGPDYKQEYTIWYREAGVSEWSTIPVTPSGSTQVTINRLSPATTYEFQVVGKNALGDGMLSKVITVRTLDVGITRTLPSPVSEKDFPRSPEDGLDMLETVYEDNDELCRQHHILKKNSPLIIFLTRMWRAHWVAGSANWSARVGVGSEWADTTRKYLSIHGLIITPKFLGQTEPEHSTRIQLILTHFIDNIYTLWDIFDYSIVIFPTDSTGGTLFPPVLRPKGPKPGIPRNLTVTEIPNGFLLTWQSPLERSHLIQYYTIKYRTDGPWKTLNKGQIRPEDTSYLVKNLVGGRTYYFRVLANSVRSYESSEEIKYSVPARVKHKAITAGVVGGILFFIVAIILSVCAVKICNKRKRRKQEKGDVFLSSPMTSLVLTDSSQLTADGFEKLPDQIVYPYAEPYDLQEHTTLKKHFFLFCPLRESGPSRLSNLSCSDATCGGKEQDSRKSAPGLNSRVPGVNTLGALVKWIQGSLHPWDKDSPLQSERSLGRIHRAPDGRFVLVDSSISGTSSRSSSDDGGFLSWRRASWRRPLVGYPSQLSLETLGGYIPQSVPAIYRPSPRYLTSSSPAVEGWSPSYNFSDLSSVRQTSSSAQPTPPSYLQLRSVHERYSQELPSLRAIHEETWPSPRGRPPRGARLHARHARSAPELVHTSDLLMETSPSSSSGFGSKNTSSQQNQSSGSVAEWRLPPYRPPPPPPLLGPWLAAAATLRPPSPEEDYEFDPALTPTPTERVISDSDLFSGSPPWTVARQPKRPTKYDNIEARVQAMKEEFHQFRKRQARRRRSEELESAC
uniref:Protein turtle n=1 Tax=Timema shepardi TaxID=629360 RepID=A0A7R9FX53_TIMSH|nr:unnamed protein product [Timema shepardi]